MPLHNENFSGICHKSIRSHIPKKCLYFFFYDFEYLRREGDCVTMINAKGMKMVIVCADFLLTKFSGRFLICIRW